MRNGPRIGGLGCGPLVSAETNSGVEEISAALSLALKSRFPETETVSGGDAFERSALIRRSVQEFDRSGLQAFLTLADLHPNTLTFSQPAQPSTCQCRRVDE